MTHDVPAYAIVAGNPAHIIGQRFNKEEIELHESRLYFEEKKYENRDFNNKH